jgi:hypothetical protein
VKLRHGDLVEILSDENDGFYKGCLGRVDLRYESADGSVSYRVVLSSGNQLELDQTQVKKVDLK